MTVMKPFPPKPTTWQVILAGGILFGSCSASAQSSDANALLFQVISPAPSSCRIPDVDPVEKAREIDAVIDQLVFAKEGEKVPVSPSPEFDTRYARCQAAFKRLSEMQGEAMPFLRRHLKDPRQSIPFRNHVLASTVGDACYHNLYFQLQDRPKGYSSYGYQRKGRDGRDHPKPYWEGTPFDDAGGLGKWIERNKGLSYTQLQIKCLEWLLVQEKAIGASDAESYFENILPLEIHLLERRLENHEKAGEELERLRKVQKEKLVDAIPADLLPPK
jgi:hypothetical protein